MRTLVTGAGGFAGRHLCRRLADAGHTVLAVVNPANHDAPVLDAAEQQDVDLLDDSSLFKVVETAQPELVFHLAAISSPHGAWSRRRITHEVNYFGTLNLLEAVLSGAPDARVVLIGSASAYGVVPPERQPIREDEPLQPRDPYGASKAAAEMLGLQYSLSFGLDVVLLRPFNHTGPGQGAGFVCSDFARQVALIEAELAEPVLLVGNLSPRRVFLDVRDVVEAYRLSAAHCDAAAPYNISGEESFAISSVLDRLIELSDKRIEVRTDESKLRPVDNPLVLGDSAKFREKTGWSPQIDFWQQTLPDLLDHWRQRIHEENSSVLP